MRPNTERPITCDQGTNIMVGNDRDKILEQARQVLASPPPKGRIPEKWDGHAAERIVEILLRIQAGEC
jgi:UDP-N-acetylglucosamine 2-epimerase (non-hydrolysing)